MIKNIPNILTILRFLLAPVIAYFIFQSKNITALSIFIFAELTDLADGYIARKYKMISKFGTIVDPIVDKIVYGVILISIIIKYNLTFWGLFYIFAILIFIPFYLLYLKKGLKVSKLGKKIAIIEVILMIIMLYGFVNNFTMTLFAILLLIPSINYLKKMIKQ